MINDSNLDPAADPIKNIVLLMLENHSFDQMLGALESVYPDLEGPSRTKVVNHNKDNVEINQVETRETQMLHDPFHETADVIQQINGGKMDGFVKNLQNNYYGVNRDEQHAITGYYPLDFLPALHTLGRHFAVCDHWFASVPGPTWPNRFFALSGSSNGMVKMPEKNQHFGMLWNQPQDTIFDRLNEAGLDWNVYYYDFPCSLILERQQEPGKAKHYKKIKNFFDTCADPNGALPVFSLIEPKFNGTDQNDDHPPHNVMKAQKLIADVYNALSTNLKLWEKTLLVVLYDEHGGFFDHVAPPEATPPSPFKQGDEYTFDRLGVRVPAILVSKWVNPGVVKTVFDHTSLLKYMQEKWQLNRLTARVDAAASIGPIIQKVARTEPIPGAIRIAFTDLNPEHPDWELADVSKHHESIMEFIENEIGSLDSALVEEKGLGVLNWLMRQLHQIASSYSTMSRDLKSSLGSNLVRIGHHFAKERIQYREQLVSRYTDKLLNK